MEFPIRINKYIKEQGIATRKEADLLIEAGQVFIDGKKAKLGEQVFKDSKIEVRKSHKNTYTYMLFNKPRGLSTHKNTENKKGIIEYIKRNDLFPIGRLDKDSSGLILLTNDGRITDRLLNPIHDHEKEYLVNVDKPLTNFLIKHFKEGIHIEKEKTKGATLTIVSPHNAKVILTEGKKHEIRRMFAAFGYVVKNLKRVRIMNLRLGNLSEGKTRELTEKERDTLLKELKLA